jgi:hypothetical protein
MQEGLKLLFFAIALALVALLSWAWGRAYWERRIIRWAGIRGLRLIEYRGATAFEGPQAFLRSENQSVFRVKVRDGNGKVLRGWLVFGRNWNPFSAPDELVDEIWD